MRTFLALCLISTITACSAAPPSTPLTQQQTAPTYHIVQTADSVAVADAYGRTIESITMLPTGSFTRLPDGSTETITFRQLHTGLLRLGNGRTIRVTANDATYYDASGRVLSKAILVSGGIQIVGAHGVSHFVAQTMSPRHVMGNCNACCEDWIEYDLALAAEAAAALTADPIGVALAFAAAEIASGRIRQDCYYN